MCAEDMDRMLLGLCNVVFVLACDFSKQNLVMASAAFEEDSVLRWLVLQDKVIVNTLQQLKWELRRSVAVLEITPDATAAVYDVLKKNVLSVGAYFVSVVYAHFTPYTTNVIQLCGLIKASTPLALGLFYVPSEDDTWRVDVHDLEHFEGQGEGQGDGQGDDQGEGQGDDQGEGHDQGESEAQ